MNDYGTTAKAFWWFSTLLGMSALALSLTGVSHQSSANVALIAMGAALAAIAGLFPVRVPGVKESVSAAEIFVFFLLISFGAEAAVVAAAAEAACISWRTSKRWTSRIASPAMAALAMMIAGTIYVRLAAMIPGDATTALPGRLLLLAAMAALYFAIGTLLISTLLRLKRGDPIRPLAIFAEHVWLALVYAVSAGVAGLLQASFAHLEPALVVVGSLISAALLAMLHLYYSLLRRGAQEVRPEILPRP